MKRSKSVESLHGRRWKLPHLLLGAAALYLLFIALKFRRFLEVAAVASGDGSFSGGLDRPVDGAADIGRSLFGSAYRGGTHHRKLEDGRNLDAPRLPREYDPLVLRARQSASSRDGYGRITGAMMKRYLLRGGGRQRRGNFSELVRMAQEAWALGRKAWEEVENYDVGADFNPSTMIEGNQESCPSSTSMSGAEFAVERVMFLPCGLVVGSSITVVGTPQNAHQEYVPQLAKLRQGDGTVMVSQFMIELQGLKAVDGEEPPKILHLNPRLKGDWSQGPIIEHNTCYRMQWGKSLRCDGVPSKEDDETVDGVLKCEKWEHVDTIDSKQKKTNSWLRRFIGHAKTPEMIWPFPFVEGKLFVLTIQVGFEGYHIYVGGRHVSSFPYRTGFTVEDATGLAIKGDVDVHSVYATSLPTSHPSFSVQQMLEMSERWKSPPLPQYPIQLFIGILSSTNHFAERMAVRKTWMQYPALQSSSVVARFFVALSQRKEINAALKKEAEYFKDIVILPFMDHYDLVVLKTIAICEFGVHNLTAAYIMKCDDDTFVRVDVMLRNIEGISPNTSIYMGNLNLLHEPLRNGKWAVTFEEWPEEVYPPYNNGPGYIISDDIARFVVSKHANQSLRLFKMEDVSMGMWVEEFNSTITTVQYLHSTRFCQYGCMENYYTAHYQSPRQMICLWEKLSHGRAQCCNFR